MSDSVTNRDCLGLYQSLSALHMMALSKLLTYDRHPLALPLLGRRPRLASNNNTVFLASSGTSEQAGSDETTASTRPRVHTSITALALSCLSRKTATTRFRYGLRTSRHEAGRHVKTGEDAGKHRHVPLVHPLPPPRLASSSLSITLFVLIHTPMLATVRPSVRPPASFIVYPSRMPAARSHKLRPPRKKAGASWAPARDDKEASST